MRDVVSITARRVARAFSLIEVLIAVLVLALGLLGLAAVFPVVIAQQRDAVDRTRGAIVSGAVKLLLEDAENLVRFDALRRDFYFSSHGALDCSGGLDLAAGEPRSGVGMDFLWEPTWSWDDAPSSHWYDTLNGEGIDPELLLRQTGTILVGFGETFDSNCQTVWPAATEQFSIPVTARLFPEPYSGEEPQYVWDIVPRRARGSGGGIDIEIAVFIRRIDPSIRAPMGFTLSDVLAANPRLQASQWRLPLGEDANGRPTGNGTPANGGGRYSIPRAMPVLVRADKPTVLVLDTASPDADSTAWSAFVAVPGQTLVDNLGHVLNVIRVPESSGGELTVEVDRKFSTSETDFIDGIDERGTKVEQVLFTPQRPVRVFTYRPGW